MKQSFTAFILVNLIVCQSVYAYENATQIGRYITLENKAKSFQADLLSQTIQVRFPQNIQTINEAMKYLLNLSGYTLIPDSKMNAALKIIVSKPLPLVDRELGPLSLKSALSVLVGPAFYLTEDSINRVVDFGLRSSYKIKYEKKYL